MSDEMNANEWKQFLQARLAQEKGDDAGALKVFDSLLSSRPGNSHLIASKSYALARLNKHAEAAVLRLDVAYSEAGKTLTGSQDRPDLWEAKLNELIASLDGSPQPAAIGMVAW